MFEVSPPPPTHPGHQPHLTYNYVRPYYYLLHHTQHDQSQCKSDDRLKMSEDRKRAAPPTTPTTPTSKAIPELTTQSDQGEIKEEKETAPATKK